MGIAEKVFEVRGQRSGHNEAKCNFSQRDSHQLLSRYRWCVQRRHSDRQCSVEDDLFYFCYINCLANLRRPLFQITTSSPRRNDQFHITHSTMHSENLVYILHIKLKGYFINVLIILLQDTAWHAVHTKCKTSPNSAIHIQTCTK